MPIQRNLSKEGLFPQPLAVKFLINGDPFYCGLTVILSRDSIYSFNALITHLTKRLPVSSNIPNGVHRIYSLETLKQIRHISDLRDGVYYVCSGFERLKNKKFFATEPILSRAMANARFDLNHVIEWNSRQKTKKSSTAERKTIKTREMKLGQDPSLSSKVIIIWQYGPPPQHKMSLLLKQQYLKPGQFTILYKEITDYFTRANRRGKMVGTLYSIRGRIINKPEELFSGENVFIFVPLNHFPKIRVIHSMLINIFHDGPYTDHLLSCWSQALKASENLTNQKSPRNRNTKKISSKLEKPRLKRDKSPKLNIFPEISKKVPQVDHITEISKNKRKYVSRLQNDQENFPKLVKRTKSPVLPSTNISKVTPNSTSQSKHAELSNNELSKFIEQNLKIKRPAKLPAIVKTRSNFYDDYILSGKIGDGHFAVVHKTKKITTGGIFAVKIVDKSKYVGKETLLRQEVNILSQCNHENIIKLYEKFYTVKEVFMVMELAELGDLFDHIKANSKFSEKDSSEMVRDIANALFYLHSRLIMHRDVKPENILINRRPNGTKCLKLGDFGLAMEANCLAFTVCGTPTYVAPEILKEIGYGMEVDLWALGIITYIFMVGFPPFRSPDGRQTHLFEIIKRGSFSFHRPHWDNIGASAKDLISHLLKNEKHKRFKAIDVLCHPWILSRGNSLELPDQLSVLRSQSRLNLEREAMKAVQFRLVMDTIAEI